MEHNVLMNNKLECIYEYIKTGMGMRIGKHEFSQGYPRKVDLQVTLVSKDPTDETNVIGTTSRQNRSGLNFMAHES